MKLTFTIVAVAMSIAATAQNPKTMKHELKPLPYAITALEPAMSAETLSFHHGKHLLTYVTNLNNLIVNTDFEQSTLEDIVKRAEGAIFNNGAQVMNHEMFFATFSPKPQTHPQGHLLASINASFGSLEQFKEDFTKASLGLFGSGWVWLAADSNGGLQIISEPNAGNPLRKGLVPLLCADVWEHTYYIDYRNRRADYLKAFWSIVDWRVVDARYDVVVNK